MNNIILIDGSHLEGGGQIIRTSMTLSAITQKPVRITNIRANRPNPGLQAQHLTACKAVRNVCRGTLTGAEIGSKELTFEPGPIVGGKYEFDIGTAGSVTLVAQTLIPILLGASKESELRVIGGTHVMKSPGYDYFERVFIPAIAMFGASVEARMLKPGYYPKGGGIVELDVKPTKLHGCTSWIQEDNIQVLIRLSGLPTAIAIREKKIFVQNNIGTVMVRENEALSVGNAITAWKGFRGAYALGEKGKRAEIVAQECLDALKVEKNDVDMHLADQLLIYAALADGVTRYTTSRISDHLRTNAYIISKFVDRKIGIGDGTVEIG
ncbi:MAG: RNA 3'-terminal phosphate cyclase [Candidatus ainarchaeum sp.]|nr:RNA 3'-terminal phosphate cyclase [Candidatus ainarchaeum sp.]